MVRNKRFKWTEQQEEVIRELYPKLGARKLAERMQVSASRLQGKARCMNVKFFREFAWTVRDVEVVKNRYETDGPARLAKELGTTCWSVTAKARRLGIGSTRKNPPKGFRWSRAMIAAIKERYVKEGGDALASEFGIAIDTLRRKASQLSLHTIAGHARAGSERAEDNDTNNIRYFDTWSPNMAYILGFLFADGCIDKTMRSVRITIASRDRSVLSFVKKEIESSQKVYHRKGEVDKRTGKTNRPQSILALNSTIMVRRLMELGMMPGKTYRDDPFPNVPDDMLPHFIRGYFDGDGCVSVFKNKKWDVCQVGFVGSVKFITGIRDSLVRLAGMNSASVHVIHGKTVDYANVYWSRTVDHRKFFNFVYPDGHGFCFSRKKDKLTSWLSKDHKETKQHRPWTSEEEVKVRKLYRVVGPTRLAELLGRDRTTLHGKIKQFGLLPLKKENE